MKLSEVVKRAANKVDTAIALAVAAAYPMVLNMPTPDPLPDWKKFVRMGWRLVKFTVKEAFRILVHPEK